MADQASQPTDSVAGENGTFAASADAEPHEPVPNDAVPQPVHDDLLGELARAMHLAATSQYERMNAELERLRTDQVDEIGTRASGEVEQLKAGSETDISAIDAWAKAETEKIKLERLRRIDARRERLAAQLERQGSIKEREIVAIQVAIDAHRGEVDRFFSRMERETDPAAIARVASTLPGFPPLDQIAEAARRDAAAELPSPDAEIGPASTTPTETATDDAASAQAATTPPAATTEPAATEAAAETAAASDAPPAAVPAPEPRAVAIEADSDARISESRLMAVMSPDSDQVDAEPSRPWEAPHAVTVAAGATGPEPAAEPETPSRVGSTLLRTVRAIRPMSGERHDRGGGNH